MRRLPLIAIALIAAAGTAWASGALVVPSRVEVGGGRVAIGDVVQGDLPKTVARAFLCKAPSLGSETSITGTFIAARVRQAGAGDLALALPERVTIVRSSQSVSAEKIRHAAEKALRDAPGGRAAEIKIVSRVGDVDVPPGDVRIETRLDEEHPVGRVVVPVEIRVGERFGKTVRVSAFVNVPVEIVAARHSIAKNQVLTADDLETRTMDATRIRGAVIRSLDDAVGLVARRAVSAGEPLKKSDLAAAPVVRKGDIVTLVVQSPGLSLTAYGVVQESAAAGDVAKIQNLDSGVELRARITDAHTAHVEL